MSPVRGGSSKTPGWTSHSYRSLPVIEGRGFTHGVSAVRFGGVAAQSFTVDSYSRITAVSPAAAAGTSVAVTLVNEGGRASSADPGRARGATSNATGRRGGGAA